MDVRPEVGKEVFSLTRELPALPLPHTRTVDVGVAEHQHLHAHGEKQLRNVACAEEGGGVRTWKGEQRN